MNDEHILKNVSDHLKIKCDEDSGADNLSAFTALHIYSMNKDKRFEIFSRLQKDNPTPTTELNFNSNFELLIAVIRILIPRHRYPEGKK